MKYLITMALLLGCSSNYNKSSSHKFIPNLEEKRMIHESFGNEYMITTQGDNSSSIGKKVFEMGGNAFDAFTAVSFAISVERPQSTGLGGGGFLLYKTPDMKKPMAVDFREKAPFKAHRDMYLDKQGNAISRKSLDGIFAVGVPGLVAGVLEVHKKYGKLSLNKILEPVAKFAENGFNVYPELERALQARKDILKKFPASKKIFFKGDRPLKTGEKLVQKDLAKTIRIIAKYGRRGFYKGQVADAIVKENERLNGLITHKDMQLYNVIFRKPVEGSYKGNQIYSMSPPSSGGTHVIEILNIVENDNLKSSGFMSPRHVHLVSSAMQQSFADRAKYLGDAAPD